jgi:pyruvate/2-oxoglutarate dehydrogenase complex dihydrolipoamide dehydrogenase (E3) component
MVDYDVVVIGATPAGISAALKATSLKARVALVAYPLLGSTWSQSSNKYSKALNIVGRIAHQIEESKAFGLNLESAVGLKFGNALKWSKTVVSTLDEQYSPAVLAALGVDVILASGEFCRKPHLGFVANGEILRSRHYLIATGSIPIIPDIDGLDSTGYLTWDTLWQQTDLTTIESLAIVGGDPMAIELAQTFARLGSTVTLVVSGAQILPEEDAEADLLIQAQLEAEGIRILTSHQVTQVRWIGEKKWLQAGDKAIEADEILIAVGQQANIEDLNLKAVGVTHDRFGIKTNLKLQTTNRRIYCCGEVMGGYRFIQIANYEAKIALKNMLFYPFFQVDYRHIPWAIFSDPEVARVGLTESQARRKYGENVLVLRRYFKENNKAQMRGETTGFCKILAHRNGEILGVHVVGAEASESIGAIALAMQQKIKVDAIAHLPTVFPTFSEILAQTAADWEAQRLKQNVSKQNFLESFFNFRRSWS